MKVLLLAVPFVLPLGDRLATEYAQNRSVRVVVSTSLDMETVESEMLVNGEPVEGRGGRERSSDETRTIEYVDEWLAVEDGELREVRRSFETLAARGVARFGDNERDIERDAPLADVTLMLAVTESGLSVEVVEGDAPDQALQGQRPELSLDALLPDGEVALNEVWNLEAEAIARALGLDLEATLFPEPEREPEDEGGRRGRGVRGARSPFRPFHELDWSGTATLHAAEEHAGQRCARIALEIRGEGELTPPERGGRRGGRAVDLATEARLATEFEVVLEGTLWFAVERGLPVELTLAGSVTSDQHTEFTRGDMTRTMIVLEEGEFTHSVQVTLQDAADEPAK
ncbi:MAG: hypothetical protein WD226_01060 [Planctomycetota bacterium]